jgi:uncharacterized protein YqgC (DUF456 family)
MSYKEKSKQALPWILVILGYLTVFVEFVVTILPEFSLFYLGFLFVMFGTGMLLKREGKQNDK